MIKYYKFEESGDSFKVDFSIEEPIIEYWDGESHATSIEQDRKSVV